MNKHGGARKGAGRKPGIPNRNSSGPKVERSVSFDPKVLEIIKGYAERYELSFSKAVNEVCRVAITHL